jgi:hypothetical protein
VDAANKSAKRVGRELRRAMEDRRISVHQIADETGKRVEHIEAVLEGYPNTRKRPTQPDTVDDIARAVGLKLGLTALD